MVIVFNLSETSKALTARSVDPSNRFEVKSWAPSHLAFKWHLVPLTGFKRNLDIFKVIEATLWEPLSKGWSEWHLVTSIFMAFCLLLFSSVSWAQLDCGAFRAASVGQAQQSLNESAQPKSVLVPYRQRLTLLGNDDKRTTLSFMIPQITTEFLKSAESLVIENAVQRTVEIAYRLQDPSALKGSLANQELTRIAANSVRRICQNQCTSERRQKLQLLAQTSLKDLIQSGDKRQSPEDILEALNTDLAALNMLADRAASLPEAYTDYQLHHFMILTTPHGALFFANYFGENNLRALSLTEIQKGQRHSSIDQVWRVRRAFMSLPQELDANWGIYLKRLASGTTVERLKTLLISSPAAVIKLFQLQPVWREYFCAIMQDFEDQDFKNSWQSSVGAAQWKLVPWGIALLTVYPTLMAAAPLSVIAVGLIAIELHSMIDIQGLWAERDQALREASLQKALLLLGQPTRTGLSTMQSHFDKASSQEILIARDLALKVLGIGIAQAVTRSVHKSYLAMSKSEIFSKLMAQIQSSKAARRNLGAVLRTKVSEDEAFAAYRTLSRSRREHLDEAYAAAFFKKSSRAEIDALFFAQRDFGFGRSLFLTELGINGLGDLGKLGQDGLFGDINPVTHLYEVLKATRGAGVF